MEIERIIKQAVEEEIVDTRNLHFTPDRIASIENLLHRASRSYKFGEYNDLRNLFMQIKQKAEFMLDDIDKFFEYNAEK